MSIKTASQLCIKTCYFRQRPLIFVRRGVNYCNAVATAIVALLGRFLPRLGPLANASGLFLRQPRPGQGLEPHDPEKYEPVFAKDQGASKRALGSGKAIRPPPDTAAAL